MPLTPKKRRGSRRRSKRQDLASSSDSSGDDYLGSRKNTYADSPSESEQRYRALLDGRLRGLLIGCRFPDAALPSGEVLQALTSPSFVEGEIGDILVELEVKSYLRTHRRSSGLHLGEFDSADDPVCAEVSSVEYGTTRLARYNARFGSSSLNSSGSPSLYQGFEEYAANVPAGAAAMYSVDDDIPYEEFVRDANKLISRTTPVDEYTELFPEEVKELELKRALYRIRACLLLKGQHKVDDAALESKFPRKLIQEKSFFLDLNQHEAFGWYFDPKLCQLASLNDYQRLVVLNYGGYLYQDWSRYRSLYNTPETDREYLLYWKKITEKIKWVEDYMYLETFSLEWSNIKRKASYQAIKIATEFENIHYDLACLGIEEFLWSTRLDVYNLKDLDGVFFEIWKQVIKEENVMDCFAKALKKVYDLKMFPSRERSMKYEKKMAEQFKKCTVGLTAEVPELKARQLIAQHVTQKLTMAWGYEHYARKKLKIAEYIGLIGKASMYNLRSELPVASYT